MTIFYTILCLCLFQSIPFSAAVTHKCREPNKELLKQLGDQYGLDVRDVNHVLTYEYKDTFIELPTSNYTAVYFGHVKVNFEGHVLPKGKNAGLLTKEKFDINSVIVHYKVLHSKGKKVQCQVDEADLLKTKITSNPQLSIIHQLTVACLEDHVCGEWDTLVARDFIVKQQFDATIDQVIRDNEKKRQNKRYLTTSTIAKVLSDSHNELQSTWNSIFDVAKNLAIKQMIGKNNGILVKPEVKFNFSAMGITGDFILKNISVAGLTSLERIKDLIVTRNNNRYDISTALRVKDLKVKIPYYKGRYGKIAIDGIVGANVSELAVSVRACVDYNVHPCKIQVNELTEDKLEKPKVDFTGLGLFNWPARKFAEYFIRNNLFDMTKKMIASQIKHLDCEDFRSAFEGVKL